MESDLRTYSESEMSGVSGVSRFSCPESTPEVGQFCGKKSPDSPDLPIQTPKRPRKTTHPCTCYSTVQVLSLSTVTPV